MNLPYMPFKSFGIALLACLCLTGSVNSQTGWKTYHHKNGFVIQLPGYFSAGLLVAGGTLQWFNNSVDDHVELCVETFGGNTQEELNEAYRIFGEQFKSVTYKVLRPGWFVISGEGEMGITYRKSIIRNGMMFHLSVIYPNERRAFMDKILPKISASFK